MGIVASSSRLHILTARKNDIDMHLLSVTEEITEIQSLVQEKLDSARNLDPSSDEYKQFEVEKEYYNAIEKKLELKQKEWEQKLQATTQEIQACEQMLAKNTQGAFTYTLGGGQ